MRHLNKNVLRGLYILFALILLIQPIFAAGESSFTTANFRTGLNGIEIIKQYEGFDAKAYYDNGQYTIGIGSNYNTALRMFPNNPKDENGRITLTRQQAEQVLMEELRGFETSLNSYLNRYRITVNQNQFDALVSFSYNVGSGWMSGQNSDGTPYKIRTLLEKTSPEDWTAELVQEAFGGWINAGGKPLEALSKRRASEAALFVTPYNGNENGDAFIDVDDNAWYINYVLEANRRGIMTGNGDGTFAPEKNMSRAELVTALAKYVKPDLSQYQAGRFRDVSSKAWYAQNVAWAAAEGLVNGVDENNFEPEASITRERICNIIARFLRSQNVAANLTAPLFRDEKLMSADAIDDVYYCASLGIVSGHTDGNFAPQDKATRAEVAKMLTCMVQVLEKAQTPSLTAEVQFAEETEESAEESAEVFEEFETSVEEPVEEVTQTPAEEVPEEPAEELPLESVQEPAEQEVPEIQPEAESALELDAAAG